eukprot:GEMP01054831.1.p1 GENE.GEMP01054831.1~~GEMP01054831.1.p1  ORF type:complete len:199 (+),score=23.68 GEMP01054831.1:47-643(+)
MEPPIMSTAKRSRSRSPPPPTDSRRVTAISNLQKRGISEQVARAMERGLYEAAAGKSEMEIEEYKEYQYNYKRLMQHYRRNAVLRERLNSRAAPDVVRFAQSLASLDDEHLMSDQQRTIREQHKIESFQDALGIDVKDDALWTPTDVYTCRTCESEDCKYMNTISSSRKEDQSDDPIVTVRCQSCSFLWKAEGDTFSG